MKESGVQAFVLEYIKGKKYFSVRAVKVGATKEKLTYSPATINQYLYNLRAREKLFDAGRGWYSTISQTFVLNTTPVEDLASLLRTKFPLLEFSCWSTEQLQGFAHHMMASFTRLVYTEADSIPSVAEFLKEKNYDVHLNPRKGEVKKYFSPSSTTVVVRPSVSEEPLDREFATVEKILVDLFLEKNKLNLMDEAEYSRLFRNLAFAYRINMARLLRYADRRKRKKSFVDGVLTNFNDVICI